MQANFPSFVALGPLSRYYVAFSLFFLLFAGLVATGVGLPTGRLEFLQEI